MPDGDTVNVRYLVDDVAACVDFYTSHFGFAVGVSSPAFADVTRGNLRLLLSGPRSSAGREMTDGERPGPGGWNRIHLIVDDINGEMTLRGTSSNCSNRQPRKDEAVWASTPGHPSVLGVLGVLGRRGVAVGGPDPFGLDGSQSRSIGPCTSTMLKVTAPPAMATAATASTHHSPRPTSSAVPHSTTSASNAPTPETQPSE